MQRSTATKDDSLSLDDTRMHYAFRRAAVAIILFDPLAAEALLDLPDAEVGRRFKISLARSMGRAVAFNLDLSSIREDEERLGASKRASKRRRSARRSLVAEGKLLRAAIIRRALGITGQRLIKDVAASCIFTVNVGGEEYFPAFFLAPELGRKALAKVVRRLYGLSGWTKWRFFTEQDESLGGLTPLQGLMHGEVKLVLRAAEAFVARWDKGADGSLPGVTKS